MRKLFNGEEVVYFRYLTLLLFIVFITINTFMINSLKEEREIVGSLRDSLKVLKINAIDSLNKDEKKDR